MSDELMNDFDGHDSTEGNRGEGNHIEQLIVRLNFLLARLPEIDEEMPIKFGTPRRHQGLADTVVVPIYSNISGRRKLQVENRIGFTTGEDREASDKALFERLVYGAGDVIRRIAEKVEDELTVMFKESE